MIVDTLDELSTEEWIETFPPKYLKIIAKELEEFVYYRRSEYENGFFAGRDSAGCKTEYSDVEAISKLVTTFSIEQYFTYREIILNEKIRGQIENCDNDFLKNFDKAFRIAYDNSNTNQIRLFDTVTRGMHGSMYWNSRCRNYVIFLFRITLANNRKLKGVKNESRLSS
ncbi:MAG: hypothetical protein HOD60_12275 [Candidatus Nitrosopelagicus sp.]|nr:hypothetical protein [Candidatus Nitrosopelagicus sp.]